MRMCVHMHIVSIDGLKERKKERVVNQMTGEKVLLCNYISSLRYVYMELLCVHHCGFVTSVCIV